MDSRQARWIELKRFDMPGHMCFVTKVTKDRRPVFTSARNVGLLLAIMDACRRELGFLLVAYCVLPDHFHWLLAPSDRRDVSGIMKRLAGASARRINVANGWQGTLWQHQFLDHVLREEEDWSSHMEYVHMNAVKHGLVASPEEYPWSSYRDYHGGSGPLEIDRPVL